MRLVERFKKFYDDGYLSILGENTPNLEQIQSITLESMVKAFARKYNLKESIPVEDILSLAEDLNTQSIKRDSLIVNSVKHIRRDLDSL